MWRKRLFIGCIPIEANVVNVQLHFSQFGHVLGQWRSQEFIFGEAMYKFFFFVCV